MNMLQSFTNSEENLPLYNGKTLPADEGQKSESSQAQNGSEWRRVREVILVEGQIRYLVERGE